MLQIVRKYTQGWVATLMGIILTMAFVLWGIENYQSGSSKKNIAAKVNGKSITLSEVNNDFQRLLLQLKGQMGSSLSLNPHMQKQLRKEALSNLIIENVLIQSAMNAGFRVTHAEVSAMIRQMPVFQVNGVFSRERFQEIINRMGFTKEEFFTATSQSLLVNQVASGVIGSQFVLPNELKQASLLEQKRDIEYVIIPSKELGNRIITPAQMTGFYQQNPNLFTLPAQMKLEYVQLSVDNLKKSIAVETQEINNYFEANSNLDQKNQKHIEQAKEYIKNQKLEQAFLAASDKLTDLAYTNSSSLGDAASSLGLKINTTEYFTSNGGNSLVTKNPKVIAAAFNSDILKDRTNSNLIEISPGNVVIVRVKDYLPAKIAPFENVKDKIAAYLSQIEAKNIAKQKGERLLSKIKSQQDFAKVASAEHLAIISKRQLSRHDNKFAPEISKLAFSTTAPASGTQLTNGDFVILTVKSISNMSSEKMTPEQNSTMKKMYSNTYGKLEYNLYIENQVSKAKIKTYLSE